MTGLHDELRRMPPEMRAILRHLLAAPDGATRKELLAVFGFHARVLDQAIRRLVTPEFIVMEGERIYYLTNKGAEAAELIDQVAFEGSADDEIRADGDE